jgi:hypothetical protein
MSSQDSVSPPARFSRRGRQDCVIGTHTTTQYVSGQQPLTHVLGGQLCLTLLMLLDAPQLLLLASQQVLGLLQLLLHELKPLKNRAVKAHNIPFQSPPGC